MTLNNQNWKMINDNEIIKKHCEKIKKLLTRFILPGRMDILLAVILIRS